LKAELETLRAEKAASEENARQLQEKLKKAEKDPTIPKKKLDEIRKEAETAAKEQAEKAAEKRLAEAEEKVAAANAELNAAKIAEKDALAKLEDAQKKLKTASPEVAAFKTLFDQMQGIAERLQGMLRVMTESDPATAAKLSAAMKAFGESVQG
jgi:chromosome segregation ATPase